MHRLAAILVIWFLSSGFYLSWNQDTTIPVTNFEIERKVKNGTGAVIAKIAGTARTYQDTTALTPDQTYCYQIRSIGKDGSSPLSSEICAIYAGVRIYVDSGQTVLVSRRATSGSSVVALLVNANQNVVENQPGPIAGAVLVNMRPGITLTTSKRATSGASTISILVNANETVTVNGVKK